jgi:hypothetical protein
MIEPKRPEHQALQQQPGLGPAGFRHRGALGVPQPASGARPGAALVATRRFP